MAKLNFSTDGIEPMQSFGALPAGSYSVEIVDTEMKATKAGTGEYLQITFDVNDGAEAGRKLWARLNLSNPNKTAEEIAARELAAICAALNIDGIEDSEELHGQMLIVDVAIEKNQSSGSDTNRIRGYSAIKAAPKASAKPAANAATAAKPWQKRAA